MINKKNAHTIYLLCKEKYFFHPAPHNHTHNTIYTHRVKTRQRHVSQRHVSQQHISQQHVSQRDVSQRHISQRHISSSSPTIIRDKRHTENKKRQAISRPPAKIILSLKQIHIINAHIIYLLYNNNFFYLFSTFFLLIPGSKRRKRSRTSRGWGFFIARK